MNVDIGILNGRPNSGTCGHVTDPLGLFHFKNDRHEFHVTDITLVDFQPPGISVSLLEEIEVGLFDGDIVVLVHLIDNDDFIAAFQQELRNVRSNKAGSARDQDALETGMRLYGRVLVFVLNAGEIKVGSRSQRGCIGTVGRVAARVGAFIVIAEMQGGHTARVFQEGVGFHVVFWWGRVLTSICSCLTIQNALVPPMVEKMITREEDMMQGERKTESKRKN